MKLYGHDHQNPGIKEGSEALTGMKCRQTDSNIISLKDKNLLGRGKDHWKEKKGGAGSTKG